MTDSKFLYETVYKDIKAKIESNVYMQGDILKNEFDLATEYDVSRHTIRKSLDLLHSEGYIKRVKGQGTIVREIPKTEYLLSTMKSYTEMLEESDKKAHSVIFESKEIDIPNFMEDVFSNSPKTCYFVERNRLSDGEIMCVEKTYINKSLCPDIVNYITPNTSLFDLYENKYNLDIDSGIYDLQAINCPADIAHYLRIQENDAVLNMKATIKLKNDEILYFVDAYYIGEKYNFKTILKRD